MTRLRVAIADDHPVLLAGIRSLLGAMPDLELVGEATTGGAALQLVRAQRPDVTVLDISMPGMSGIDLARHLALDCPAVRLLALTAHEDRAFLHAMLAAGACGYLLKRSAAEELVRAIRAVAAGGVFLDPAIAGLALAGPGPPGRPDGAAAGLSLREADVLRHTAQGLSNKEIAYRLEISTKTVETYKARATEKLGLRSRADIVRFGAGQGWLQASDMEDPVPQRQPTGSAGG